MCECEDIKVQSRANKKLRFYYSELEENTISLFVNVDKLVDIELCFKIYCYEDSFIWNLEVNREEKQ